MQEHKFLLTTYPKHPKNYALMTSPDFERLAWVKMTEEIKPPLKYLKHFIESEWVDTSSVDGFYKFDGKDCSPANIPYGTLVYYLIVYTEEASNE